MVPPTLQNSVRTAQSKLGGRSCLYQQIMSLKCYTLLLIKAILLIKSRFPRGLIVMICSNRRLTEVPQSQTPMHAKMITYKFCTLVVCVFSVRRTIDGKIGKDCRGLAIHFTNSGEHTILTKPTFDLRYGKVMICIVFCGDKLLGKVLTSYHATL